MNDRTGGKPTFEDLSAFADGELSGDLAAGNLANDRETAALLSEIGRVDGLVRAHFGDEADLTVPDHLVASVRGGFEKRRARRAQGAWRASWLPIAASLIIAASGLAGAFFVAEKRTERQIAAYEARWQAGQRALEAALQDALETRASGTEVSFASGEAGIEGRVNPTRTYRSRSGHWCREFSEVIESAAAREFRRGLACRENGGGWQRLETTVSGNPAIRLIR